ncbi:MAG TPA: RecX family transcriptional regulator [Longimicrobiales bacterium]
MSGTITALKAQRRSPDRLNLYVDGEFRCGIAMDVVATERLRIGQTVDEAMLERLIAADEAWKAKQAALSLLGTRARGTGELTDRLRRKGYSQPAIDWAISESQRLGYLDDAAFAEAWVRDRVRLRPRGPRALAAELARKRVSPDVARAAIDRVMQHDSVSEQELCADVAAKWLRTHDTAASSPEDRQKLQRRFTAYLARRGFSSDTIRDAVAQHLR